MRHGDRHLRAGAQRPEGGKDYFAPGLTSYEHTLQYQTYDDGAAGRGEHTAGLVAGGWAVGAFTMNRVNRITAPRQALLAELRIAYEDGTEEVFGTDESWEVTEEGGTGTGISTTARCTTQPRT